MVRTQRNSDALAMVTFPVLAGRELRRIRCALYYERSSKIRARHQRDAVNGVRIRGP
jgi:hypothetical protein